MDANVGIERRGDDIDVHVDTRRIGTDRLYVCITDTVLIGKMCSL